MISISSRPSFPRFAGVRVQSCNGDARCARPAATKKIREQQTDTDYLRLLECARNLAQRNMRGDERDCDFSAGQAHCEIFDAAALSQKFGLPWEFKADFIYMRAL